MPLRQRNTLPYNQFPRPTRWTRKRRVTRPGKGGWSVRVGVGDGFWRMWCYTNPVTGHGVSADGLRKALHLRREQEAKLPWSQGGPRRVG